jgi:DNA-binding winged helix-turn-helix (wHTH) protein/Tol biopolymer transport system component
VEQANRTGQTIRFGVFDVDPHSGELRKSGTRIRLQEQPFRVLLALLERPGEVVSRDELRRRIWPDESFGDFDHAVSVAVGKLRTALGDSAEIPRYVETLHRRGYRFVFPISLPVAQKAVDAERSTLSQFPQKQTPRNLRAVEFRVSPYVAVSACFGLLAAIFAAYHWTHSKSPNAPTKIIRVSQWDKPMIGARLSPDGHAVAFASPAAGIDQVFLMLTSGGKPLQLTFDEGDKFVDDFSADGKEVYYGRDLSGGASSSLLGRDEVWVVPTLGGNPRLVPSAAYVLPSPDGASLYYVKSFDNPAIFRVGKSGLNEELAYKSQDDSLSLFPLLLFPDGNNLLAAAWRLHSPNGRIFRISLTSHETADLGEMPGNSDVAWAEPGNSILFSRKENGLTNIWKYKLQDRSLTQITFGTGEDSSPMPDPGGKGIYYVSGRFSGSLTTYNVHSKQSTDIVPEGATQPIISRDGKRVMYTTLPASGKRELWTSDIDGANKVKIATQETQEEDLLTLNWAPDNFHLSYSQGSKLYIVGTDGSGLRQLPSMAGMIISNAVWSPDQESLFVSTEENAEWTNTIWKWNDGTAPEKLVEKCGYIYDGDPAGEYLLALRPSGENAGIYEVSISERKCIPLLPGVVTAGAVFARDGKSFLYVVSSRAEIYRQLWKDGNLVGTPQVALKLPFEFSSNDIAGRASPSPPDISYDFSRDLSTIVYFRMGGNDDLYLLSQQ